MKIYTIYDQKAEAYLTPFFLPTNAAAIRSISDLVNDLDHQFGKHSSDYMLYLIGEYDEQTGTILPGKPFLVGKLIEFKTQQEMPFPSLASA